MVNQRLKMKNFLLGRVGICLLALLVCAGPAWAQVVIRGVENGATITSDLEVSAISEGPRTISMRLVLVGPDGTELVRTSDRNWIHLADGEGRGGVGALDITQFPVGQYTLAAYADTLTRSGRQTTSKTVEFALQHDGAAKQPVDSITASLPKSSPVPAITFPDSTVSGFTLGQAPAIPFKVDGALPDNSDVLVLAWSLDRSELVPGFAHTFDGGPFSISASKLNVLPAGRVELQLRPRVNGKIVDKITTVVTVQPAFVGSGSGGTVNETGSDSGSNASDSDVSEPTGSTTTGSGSTGGTSIPDTTAGSGDVTVRFAGDMPYEYVQGSGIKMKLEVQGTLPEDGDILVLMWHNDDREMVSSFAHALTGAPFEISNAKLDGAPLGNVEIQTLLRLPDQPIRIAKRPLKLVPASSHDETEDENAADYTGLSLSAAGFTQFKKSADTRVIYVAANGNDENDGLSPATAMKTPGAAYHKLRNGYPDWLLFKAGDTFTGNLGSIDKSGRSASERMVIGVYGEGDRPVFHSPADSWAFKAFNKNGSNLAFVGLHVLAVNRDPNRPGFDGTDLNGSWRQGGVIILGPSDNVLIEDCVFDYFKNALVMQSDANHGYQRGIQIRRTSILNSYGHWDSSIGGHAQGLYAQYVDGLVIDECVWDHNGWNPEVSGAKRTKFNHNIYIQDDCKNVTVKRSIITRGSSHGLQLRPGGNVEDNLFVRNALAFFVGMNPSKVLRNVTLHSDDITSDPGDYRGMGMEVLPCLNAVVANNIFSQKIGNAEWGPAIDVKWDRHGIEWLDGRTYEVAVRDNKIYKWSRYDGRESSLLIDKCATVLEDSRNHLDQASGGETDPPWVDPSRDVESYMESLGKTPTLEAFVKAAAYRPRGVWVSQYSAEAANLYIRRGFDVVIGD